MSAKPISVIVDVFEASSGIPALLAEAGVTIQTASLTAGDYDVGSGTLVERKEARDLYGSLNTGRLWLQLRKLRRSSRFPTLLVEGSVREAGLTPRQERGMVLAIADQVIVMIHSDDRDDSAIWLAAMAHRRQIRIFRHRPPYVLRPRNPHVSPQEAVLGSIPGLSSSLAGALLARFGTVQRVSDASPTEWMTVAGIGRHRARAMERAVKQPVLLNPDPRQRSWTGRAT